MGDDVRKFIYRRGGGGETFWMIHSESRLVVEKVKVDRGFRM